MARIFIDTSFVGQNPANLPSLLASTFASIEDDHNAGADLITITDDAPALPKGIRRGDAVIKLQRDELFIGMYNGVSVVYASIGTFTGAITDVQHGTRAGGTLHPVATSVLAGFMPNTDKAKLDQFKGDTTAAGPATTTQFPNNGDWGFHTDTVGITYKLARNVAGVIKTVALV
jgi:hypothetical protein